MAVKRVKCESGVTGWQARVQEIYDSLSEFKSYSDMYGIARRLGYSTASACWRANPVIQGSINPSDLKKVTV